MGIQKKLLSLLFKLHLKSQAQLVVCSAPSQATRTGSITVKGGRKRNGPTASESTSFTDLFSYPRGEKIVHMEMHACLVAGSARDLEEGSESLQIRNARGKTQTTMLSNSLLLLGLDSFLSVCVIAADIQRRWFVSTCSSDWNPVVSGKNSVKQ